MIWDSSLPFMVIELSLEDLPFVTYLAIITVSPIFYNNAVYQENIFLNNVLYPCISSHFIFFLLPTSYFTRFVNPPIAS